MLLSLYDVSISKNKKKDEMLKKLDKMAKENKFVLDQCFAATQAAAAMPSPLPPPDIMFPPGLKSPPELMAPVEATAFPASAISTTASAYAACTTMNDSPVSSDDSIGGLYEDDNLKSC